MLELKGDYHTGETVRRLYATDASAYQEMPHAVAIPENEDDLRRLIGYAGANKLGLIPRTAGTSLAGQVVGSGIVVDLSRHFTEILEINAEEGWVRVQPGVIRNELNMALKPHGLQFGPETSTQNRAMIGGMLGNNSCGSNSVKYGSTRDHVLEVRGLLSDGTEAVFGPLDREEFEAKCAGPDDALETKLYRSIRDILGDAENREQIEREFPRKGIPRRNTGYALDLLADCGAFGGDADKAFNFCTLLAGSEGTLFLATEIKLRCLPLPPVETGLLCAHFESLQESLEATLLCLKYDCYAVELIDHYILECTERNIEQRKNRFFVKGQPGAILVSEIRGETRAEVEAEMESLEADLKTAGLGYHYPVLYGEDTEKIWNLRKAGLGLLSNIPGDAKPVPVIEDAAVEVTDLPAYIAELNAMLKEKHDASCVHYAHAGSGELHVRPILDLKTEEGNRRFRAIASDVADLVKRYGGSLSGEHGDGRLRGEFIERIVGPENFALFRRVKESWDPHHLFNPGKIIDTPPMNSSLRYRPGQSVKEPETIFDFGETEGMIRGAEMCNGSGDCRKTQLSGGTMCPSYMATRDEKDTTRARANILRQIFSEPGNGNPFGSDAVKEVLDLCLSCKGCKSECPSNVDMAKLKAEFMQHYYDAHGIPLRSRMIANFPESSALASRLAPLWNGFFGTPALRRLANRMIGFHPDRTIPMLHSRTLERRLRSRNGDRSTARQGRKVFIFCDEFSNYNDVPAGIATVELLEGLGYEVVLPEHGPCGRAALSKGLLRKARDCAAANVEALSGIISSDTPLVGIEPSALLCFRDEYPDLLRGEAQEKARAMAPNCLLLEEFLARELDAGRIGADDFDDTPRTIKLHGHCQQKALSSLTPAVRALSLPRGHKVSLIPSGCCGMAGSFGYEKEHYELSQKIGELVLFPAVRKAETGTLIAAPGTSCRHQIHDGTGRQALHPAEILRDALKA